MARLPWCSARFFVRVNIELINTGSELMLGRVLNSHQQWLCRRLADHGYEVTRQVGVDDPAQFSRLFKKVMGVTAREFQRSPPVGSGAMRTEFRDRRRQVLH